MLICNSCYPKVSKPLLEKLNLFNRRLYEETMVHHNFAQEGSPWEFNLRDIIRSCEIITGLITLLSFVYFSAIYTSLIILDF